MGELTVFYGYIAKVLRPLNHQVGELALRGEERKRVEGERVRVELLKGGVCLGVGPRGGKCCNSDFFLGGGMRWVVFSPPPHLKKLRSCSGEPSKEKQGGKVPSTSFLPPHLGLQKRTTTSFPLGSKEDFFFYGGEGEEKRGVRR